MAIKEARAHKIMSNEFFSGGIGGGTIYRVPKYQRKYVRKDEQWTKLFEDIRDNEEGYLAQFFAFRKTLQHQKVMMNTKSSTDNSG